MDKNKTIFRLRETIRWLEQAQPCNEGADPKRKSWSFDGVGVFVDPSSDNYSVYAVLSKISGRRRQLTETFITRKP